MSSIPDWGLEDAPGSAAVAAAAAAAVGADANAVAAAVAAEDAAAEYSVRAIQTVLPEDLASW